MTIHSVIPTDIVRNNPLLISTEIEGTMRSSTAMSLENLVRIRPIGFESKKTTLALTSFLVMARCILEVLLMIMLKIVISRHSEARKARPIRSSIVLG